MYFHVGQIDPGGPAVWVNAQAGFVKIIMDTAVNLSNSCVRLGMVIRDSEGSILVVKVQSVRRGWRCIWQRRMQFVWLLRKLR